MGPSLSDGAQPRPWLRLMVVWLLVLLAAVGTVSANLRGVSAFYHPMADGMHLVGPRIALWTVFFFVSLIWALAVTAMGWRLDDRRLKLGTGAVIALLPLGLIGLPLVVGPQPSHSIVVYQGDTYAIPRRYGARPGQVVVISLRLCPGTLDPFYGPDCQANSGANGLTLAADRQVADLARFKGGAGGPEILSVTDNRVVAPPPPTVETAAWAQGDQLLFRRTSWDHRVFLTDDQTIAAWVTCHVDADLPCEAFYAHPTGGLGVSLARAQASDARIVMALKADATALLDRFLCPGAKGCPSL
ncbi:MAG: hypothetical protein AAFY65_17585 [Pseudomonadota bacterium]